MQEESSKAVMAAVSPSSLTQSTYTEHRLEVEVLETSLPRGIAR
jgi:hypothetical protein